MVLAEPRQIKRGLTKIQDCFEGSFTLDWLRSLLRRSGYRYRRCRASLRSARDERAFRKAQAELEALLQQNAAGQIDLYYLDEAGFSLSPTVPYAWQASGERIEQKQTGKRKINVVGLMRTRFERDEDFVPFVTESAVDTQTLVACLDHFAAGRAGQQRRTMIVLDNAPTHTSAAFKRAEACWLRRAGLQLYFLPAYSLELNRIEHLWKHIKHYWLPLWTSESFEKLKQTLDEVLAGVGTTYRITFCLAAYVLV